MQQLFIAMTPDPLCARLALPKVERAMRPKAGIQPERVVLYPEFARILSARLDKLKISNNEAGLAVGLKTGEMIRRYRGGWDMPRLARLKKLAKLVGLTPAELQHPGSTAPALPGLLEEGFAQLTADEQSLLDCYRQLPGFGRKIVRARAVELLEEFGKPTPKNPLGRGTQ